MTTRRQFLTATLGSSAIVSLSPRVPGILLQAAEQSAHSTGEKILVVVQLSGGNDGLNTVIPYADDVYARSRYTLRVGAEAVRKIDDYHGLHPQLSGFSRLLENQRLAIVQGVGYPNPNRSHFASMDIWHSARPKENGPAPGRSEGWLGRSLDRALETAEKNQQPAIDLPALHLGQEDMPLALVGRRAEVLSVRNLETFRLDDGGNARWREAVRQAIAAPRPERGELLDFLQSRTLAAHTSSRRVHETLGKYQTDVKYPGTPLAEKLRSVAQLIDAGLATRIYYVTIDGFDTHSQQAGAHAALLNQVGDAVAALVDDLSAHGHAERVLVMLFSEFGRRVKENASGGTDHGAAAPMFLAGPAVRPGLIGKHPSLTDLDQDDLKFGTDFRGIYARLLDDWLGWPSEPILGGKFEKPQFLG